MGNRRLRALRIAAVIMTVMLYSLHSAWATSEKNTLPAVQAPNFDLSVAGATLDDNAQTMVSGTASFPVFQSFGLQLDGSASTGEGDDRGGVAAHFFYRNPESHLIGATVMWSRIGDYDVMRIGPEAELYAGNASFYVTGGWQEEEERSTGYGTARASYYFTDNFVVGASATAFSTVRGGGLDAEWQPADMPFSMFAEVGDDNRSAGYALIGVRMAFGTDNASLKDKHRRYDPPNIVQTFNTRESQSVAPKAMPAAAAPPPVCIPPPDCTCNGGAITCS